MCEALKLSHGSRRCIGPTHYYLKSKVPTHTIASNMKPTKFLAKRSKKTTVDGGRGERENESDMRISMR